MRVIVFKGDSVNGMSNKESFICSLMRGVAQMKSFPDVNTEFDLTPVDFVASTIVSLSKNPTERVYHTVHNKGKRIYYAWLKFVKGG